MSSSDVIVIGAGSAGSAVARRLVDAGARVTVLEAGGPDTNPAIHDLSRFGELWASESDWGYLTVPQQHAANRQLYWPRGKVLGGSHSLNGTIYIRGNERDFDHWASFGNAGWSYNEVLQDFRSIENWSGEASDSRAVAGLLDVTTEYPRSPIQESVLEAALHYGLPFNEDHNTGSQAGVGWQQLNIRDGKRLSSYRGYLHPVVNSPNLSIQTGAWVHRLIIKNSTAVGVQYSVAGELFETFADEIIVCAGAVDSPRILMLSGIGEGDHLRNHDITVHADLPGVGRNLQDHLLVPTIYQTTTRPVEPLPFGTPGSQVHWFWGSRDGLPVPDTQPLVSSVAMVQDDMVAPASAFTIMAGLVSPQSRGTISLRSSDPFTPTAKDPNILHHIEDVRALVASLRQCREVASQAALAEAWGAREVYPGVDVQDDTSVEEYVRRRAVTYHHQSGTCKMGIDDLAVVDPQLRVHGVDGLRIADASIMPTVTTGNTNAATIMIGERVARFIIESR